MKFDTIAPRPAPKNPYGRLKQAQLFTSPLNTFLTLSALFLLYKTIPPLFQWLILDATWQGTNKADCAINQGACWPFIKARIGQFLYGFYPEEARWRVNIVFLLLTPLTLIGVLFLKNKARQYAYLFALTLYPIISWILLRGGAFNLTPIPTEKWGGMMLTLVISSAGILFSLPLGILLALGRTSKMPVIRWLSIAFIELWRGIPLILVLFMSSVMLPLFLPQGTTIDNLIRALIGVALFASAYMAEVIRGGLQGIDKGQYEAAASLGLNTPQALRLIILPQALKLVIPAITNTYVGLFKETTLVSIIGLYDFLGIVHSATQDPQWLGLSKEGYAFTTLVYFTLCYSLTRFSYRIEKKSPLKNHK